MSKQREKYLRSLTPSERAKLMPIIEQLLKGDSSGLDTKALKGHTNLYRCRVGDIRIVFEQQGNKIQIRHIGPRGDAYKSLGG